MMPTSISTVSLLQELLDEILATWVDYCHFQTDHEPIALTLWVVHTWTIEQAETTPYMWVTSAEPESGKTRVLEVARELAREARMASSVSASAIFRWVQEVKPTLLLDEIDTVFGKAALNGSETSENLRQILNAGYRRGNPAVRVERSGRSFSVKEYETFCPKAIAGLRTIPQTLASRSIEIRMHRKTRSERIRPFRIREATTRLQPLRVSLEEWAKTAELAPSSYSIPTQLGDRASDIWEPLLVIAEQAGPQWTEWASAAARALSVRADAEDDSLGVLLLSHLLEIWDGTAPHMFTETILERLRGIEEAPWDDWYGRAFTPRDLARHLKPFGVTSRQVRIGDAAGRKGYSRDDLFPLWLRYTPENRLQALQGQQINAQGTSDVEDVDDVDLISGYMEASASRADR